MRSSWAGPSYISRVGYVSSPLGRVSLDCCVNVANCNFTPVITFRYIYPKQVLEILHINILQNLFASKCWWWCGKNNSIRYSFTYFLNSQGRLQARIQKARTDRKRKQLNHLRLFKFKRKFLKISVALQTTLTEARLAEG
jgi:hypothetical protein